MHQRVRDDKSVVHLGDCRQLAHERELPPAKG